MLLLSSAPTSLFLSVCFTLYSSPLLSLSPKNSTSIFVLATATHAGVICAFMYTSRRIQECASVHTYACRQKAHMITEWGSGPSRKYTEVGPITIVPLLCVFVF